MPVGAVTPVTIPVPAPTETPPLEVQELVPDASFSVTVLPVHTTLVPVMTAGNGFTVNTSVRKHPVDAMVLVISALPVAPVAVTIPVNEPILATGILSLLQVPERPDETSVSAGSPIHILVGVQGAGAGLMFIFNVVKQPVVVTL